MRREDRKRVVIKGAGDLASGIALRLFRCGFNLVMTETAVPTTVRRTVAFSPAVYQGTVQVEDVTGVRCDSMDVVERTLKERKIAVVVDEDAEIVRTWKPDVVVDAILAKRNLGTSIQDAPLVIAVGPGFTAGKDCHCVVESKRGHYLGRCIWEGSAIPNTGVPGLIGGYGLERLIRASDDGVFRGTVSIGSQVKAGAVVGYAGETPIHAQIDGVVRGLLQDGVLVTKGMKAGDVDPRCAPEHCDTASDKAMAIGGGVLEAILSWEQRAMALEGRTAPEQDRSASKIALVLLAAGDSRRFGSNKLLADIEGKPMYRHILEEVERLPKDAFCRRILVSQYPEILTDGERSGFRAVENRESSLGISHSIRLGLEALGDGEADAVCFAVCDQPWLTHTAIAGLLKGWRESGKGLGTLSFQGRDGNPAVFSRAYFGDLAALSGDRGGRRILLAHPEDVYRYEVAQERELTDVDEPLGHHLGQE